MWFSFIKILTVENIIFLFPPCFHAKTLMGSKHQRQVLNNKIVIEPGHEKTGFLHT